MAIRALKTSNPIFNDYFWGSGPKSKQTMSVFGIFLKSLVSILVIACITAYIWKLSSDGHSVRWFTLGGMLGSIVISIITYVMWKVL